MPSRPDSRIRALPASSEFPVMASKAVLQMAINSGSWYGTSTPLVWAKNTRCLAVVGTSYERAVSQIRLGSGTGRIIPMLQIYTHSWVAWLDAVSEEEFPAYVYVTGVGYSWATAVFATLLTHSQPLTVWATAAQARNTTMSLIPPTKGGCIGLGTGGEGTGPVYGPGQIQEAIFNNGTGRGAYCWSDLVSPEEQFFNCGASSYGSGEAAMIIGPRYREIYAL